MARDPEALRAIRADVMEAFLAEQSPVALFELQVRIANELRASEQEAGDDERWHRRRLRNIGDAIAWTVLTPHAIRNLSVRGRRPPALSQQGPAFEHVVAVGRPLLDDGAHVLIADVTNCVAIGDLAWCGNPDAPILIECKLSLRSPTHHMQGRRGRQFTKARAIGSYLSTGRGSIPGVQAHKIALEVAHEPAYSWEALSAVVRGVLSGGPAFVINDREAIWAYRPEDDVPMPGPVGAMFVGKKVLLGCDSALLDDDPPPVPHPLAWPVEREVAFALAEMDVVVCHALESTVFSSYATERARLGEIIDVDEDVSGVAAEIDGKATSLGPRFLADVLYGFETVESAARHMLLGLEKSADCERTLGAAAVQEQPTRKPVMHVIKNRADMERFRAMEESGEIPANDVVMLDPEFERELGIHDRALAPGTVLLVGAPEAPGRSPEPEPDRSDDELEKK